MQEGEAPILSRVELAVHGEENNPGGSVDGDIPVAANLPQSVSVPFQVEPGASRLDVLLSARQYAVGDWVPRFRVKSPSAVVWDETSAETTGDDFYRLVRLDTPEPGEWEFEYYTYQLTPQRAFLSAHVNNPAVECYAGAEPHVIVDDNPDPVRITASSAEGLPLGWGVEYSARVHRPDGTYIELTMDDLDETNQAFVDFSDWSGRGTYDVEVACHVTPAARFNAGEQATPDEFVNLGRATGFTRTAKASFFARNLAFVPPFDVPPDDCDRDGFPNSLEGYPDLDTDDDGIPDYCDSDSDADGLPDSSEASGDTDLDGIPDRLDVDSDDDGDSDGADVDPLEANAYRWVAYGDFDGDGISDRAEGDATYSSTRGRVFVDYGDPDALDQYWVGAEDGDYYGAAVTASDIDGEGHDDLVIGAPGAQINGQNNAGSVQVLYGTPGGLSIIGTQIVHQETAGIQGTAEPNDYFGSRLAMGDFDGDGYSEVAVGVPREGIGAKSDAGAVLVIYGGPGGLTTVNDAWYQGGGGVNGTAETNDRFGDVVSVGNFDQDAYDDLVMGVPYEDIGPIVDAGAVYVMYGTAAGLDTSGDGAYWQNAAGAAGTSEAGDLLGKRFWIEDRNHDGYPDVTAFVPGDGCGPGTKGFQVTYGGSGRLTLSGNYVACADSYQTGF